MSDPIYEAQAYEIAKMARSISALEAENAKLVDVLHEVEAEAVYAYHCLQQDCVTIANSTEHFFKKWWHAECELDRLKAENTKLRELVADTMPIIGLGNVDCSGCLHMRECYAGEATDFEPENCRLVVRARELGMEAK